MLETEEYCKNHKSVALISSVGDYEEYGRVSIE